MGGEQGQIYPPAKVFVSWMRSNLRQQGTQAMPMPIKRVWLQGVITEIEGNGSGAMSKLVIDDGTGTVKIFADPEEHDLTLQKGNYILVVGLYNFETETVEAHQIIDLSNQPSRIPLWWLEVIDFFKTLKSW
uniref:OB domain-containing protein n=1 Tax=Aplanochytrium stocchinoi TaxID=215587 RepID=A0A7S3PQ42_9STRA|mmetsp:Transcript_16954/g.20931  ORF Transcript_16954/g.20931 Transcript_16954/m.20931 type:complete len:132 (-) Transcript_16954:942-1337(-)|eukprot:CAMPEP_0204880412 /NCGR_PEP_ID=MMETSP1349-20130617/1808_1 /ASSEMBLY_ACC=CAM_ASM_000710 /TAXON_ID=215587 /ORGANISM="Aplanochytrium stocchinoi, Strain GSBS06" /LENGTH=131 /DNA_ID=CAMNT_0052038843 /DNA_START=68 /DNA_END=463 /DNA_ORIENTATION=+